MTPTEPLPTGQAWSDERIERLVLYASGGYGTISLLEAKAIAAQMRDDYEAKRAAQSVRIAELEAQVAGRGEWEPVPDDIYQTDGPEVIYVKEQLLSIVGEFYVYLPHNMRLCRRKAGTEDAQP